jgi:hypothetical protein
MASDIESMMLPRIRLSKGASFRITTPTSGGRLVVAAPSLQARARQYLNLGGDTP